MKSRWMQVIFSSLVLVIAVMLRYGDPEILEDMRLKSFDLFQKIEPREYQPVPVRFVDIDDESLEKIGQWPWPRTRMAELVDSLNEAGAATIVLDILFSEPDRTSPAQIVDLWPKTPETESLRQSVASLPDHDEALAAAIDRAKNVVTGFILTEAAGGPAPTLKAGFAIAGDHPRKFVPAFSGAIVSLPAIEAAGQGTGSFNAVPERDGIIRRAPLLISYAGTVYPTLAVEALRVAQGAASYLVKASGASGEIALGNRETGITHVRVGGLTIPTDANGRIWLYDAGSVPERRVSAWKIFSGEYDPASIRGNIVYVGTSAAGLLDEHATPLHPAMPGVEIQVQLTEQILLQEYLQRPDWAKGAEIVFLIALGLVLIVASLKLGAVSCAALTAVIIGGAGAASWYGFSAHGFLIDPVYPAITGMMVYSGSSLMGFVRSESERRQIRDAFSHYMSPALVERLARDPSQLRLGGETREMTLLFCDIRGFTSISEKLDAEQLTRLVNRFLTPMTDATLAHGGTIDKYMGDAMMAFWNAPLDDPDHALHAVQTALEMRRRLVLLNDELEREAEEQGTEFMPLKVGIGLNTGLCSVGNMGSEQRFDYSALGDEVNLASRLEGQTKFYGVDTIMSSRTHGQAEGFTTIELDRIRAVGKTVPVTIHALLGDNTLAEDADVRAALVSQDAMLRAYRRQEWDRAGERLGEVRELMDGHAGLGQYLALFEQRIAAFRRESPGPDWDGVYIATSK